MPSYYYSVYRNAIYANKLYLMLCHKTSPQVLAVSDEENAPEIIGDVRIHPTATVDSTAVVRD